MDSYYHQLDLFRDRLPPRVHCTDNFEEGLEFAYVTQAVRRRYIQPNRPTLLANIPFDLDIPGGGHPEYFKHREAPMPCIVAENPVNRHSHVIYPLEIPVSLFKDGSGDMRKAAKYAAAVQFALMQKLNADPFYTGFTCKNPLHAYWNVRVYRDLLYTLDELADYLDLKNIDYRRRSEDYGVGRNCSLFDDIRRYAYKEVRQYWDDRAHGFQPFYDSLEVHAVFRNNNLFERPLMFPEVKHIINSVARWTWENFTPARFIARQKALGVKSGIARSVKAEERKQRLLTFMAENPEVTNKHLADNLGISLSTVKNYKRGSTNHIRSTASPKGSNG